MNIKTIVIAATALMAAASPAYASEIVNTGPQAAGSLNYVGSDTGIGGVFTIDKAYRITSFEYYGGGSSSVGSFFTGSIRKNGATPGDAIFSQQFNLDLAPAAWQGITGIDLLLDAGSYWLTFETPRSVGSALLYGTGFQNQLANESVRNTTLGGGDWVSTAGRADKGYGFRVNGNLASVAAVPEPATWAMMIVGFGVAGAAMRRRKRQAVAFA